MGRPQDKLSWAFTIGLVALLTAVAIWACPRHVQAGDAGEFATVMLRGGVPHPSGYPWMRILGLPARALWAMGVPPAMAAALPCALAGVAGFAILHRVALHAATPRGEVPTRGGAIVATFAVGLVALGRPVVLHVNDSEVWGPLVLFAALVVHAAVVRRSSPLSLGVLFGLAVSHHLTAALLLPIVVAAALPRPWAVRPVLRAAGLGVAGGLAGLVPPYLTLMIGDGVWRWGDTSTLGGLWHHVTRADYGVLSLSLHTEQVSGADLLARVAASMGGNLSAGLVPYALVGGALVVLVLMVALGRGGSGLALHDRIGLGGAVGLAAVVFPLTHNIDPHSPFGAWILERFDILPLALLTLLLAAALSRVPPLVAERRTAAIGLTVCAGLLTVRQSLFTAWHGVPSDNPWVERYAIDALQSPEPDRPAILVGTDDHRIFPILFAKEVLGRGQNVEYVDASLLAHPWYRARFPDFPDIDKPVLLLTTMAADPARERTVFYLTNDFSRHSAGLDRVPEGVLWRLRLREKGPARIDDVVAHHRAALSRIAPIPTAPAVEGHPFASDLTAIYTEVTAALAEALRAEGRPAEGEAIMRQALGADR